MFKFLRPKAEQVARDLEKKTVFTGEEPKSQKAYRKGLPVQSPEAIIITMEQLLSENGMPPSKIRETMPRLLVHLLKEEFTPSRYRDVITILVQNGIPISACSALYEGLFLVAQGRFPRFIADAAKDMASAVMPEALEREAVRQAAEKLGLGRHEGIGAGTRPAVGAVTACDNATLNSRVRTLQRGMELMSKMIGESLGTIEARLGAIDDKVGIQAATPEPTAAADAHGITEGDAVCMAVAKTIIEGSIQLGLMDPIMPNDDLLKVIEKLAIALARYPWKEIRPLADEIINTIGKLAIEKFGCDEVPEASMTALAEKIVQLWVKVGMIE